MTELIIDGVSVVLPADIEVQVKHENPFFTKNGEYTYDIELSLTNIVNAKLYNHLQRLNSVMEVHTKRRAILIANNRIFCNGTEVITGWTEKSVSIQIASGNSELNYFIGSDLPITSLDMGNISIPASGHKHEILDKKYPEIEYNLPPLLVGDTMVNPFELEWHVTDRRGTTTGEESRTSYKEVADGIYIPMPYMTVIIEKIIQALGYQVVENQFNDTPWKYQMIIHGQKTTEYAKMLPGWTVKEFLEEVEKLYGIIFVIDSRKKEVRIMLSANYYIAPPVAYLSSVEDGYIEEMEEDEDNDTNIGIRNVTYELPDNEYYKKRRLPNLLMEMAEKKELVGVKAVNDFFSTQSNGMELVTDTSTGVQYIRTSFEAKNNLSGEFYTLYRRCPVNEYADLVRDDTKQDFVTLKMIPVQHGAVPIKATTVQLDGNVTYSNAMRIVPVLDNEGELKGTDEESEESASSQSIEDYIKNNNYEENNAKTTVYLGFYTGIKCQYYSLRRGGSGPYPTVYTDDVLNKGLIFHANYSSDTDGDAKMSIEGETMDLRAIAEYLYKENYDINRKKKFTFHSHDPNIYDVRSIFVIHNKRFVCKECTYTINASGRKGAWTGTFYPIRISDTEADLRWILTDGKWRDGGVWLDNGRWLDD